ncbi:xylose isomerase [Zeaxanthinibacter enoshimensis]|uniref:Xylose isomerase n=1 Tax=Zeaxanthinibacter enoshimensis TaxID=392009 RepID=A0A4R6TRS2_9FLAO|nr:xylose isomerase [Zeaxanthinibacter enoshimensis]TDQ33256.1 xylose isomerase [Zeaxanthinibacter enoshimensis]
MKKYINGEYFPGIQTIKYEGPDSDSPFAYRYYEADKVVGGKTMREHLRFAVAYWHSFCGTGADPFGPGTITHPWDAPADPIDAAKAKADAAFEFITKMGLDYFCFHDFDLVREADTLAGSEKLLQQVTEYIQQKQKDTGIKVLWGTANLFSHPRYMNGAATNPDFRIVARAGAQVKLALDTTMALGGENYVFWGGREGYMSLLNTDMKRELDHLGRFLGMARNYARGQGFKGNFFIEPKPMEPMKHQYDFDAATVVGFLEHYDLLDDFKLNLEVNHATLANHSMQHEMEVAAMHGLLGSIDANRGDYQNGWDTDQFPNNIYELTQLMLVFLQAGGLKGGGINFDAKLRRNSTDPEDLFHAHIGGVDIFARALITAARILESSEYISLRQERYRSFDSGDGKHFETGKLNLGSLYEIAAGNGEIPMTSGRQELFENLINRYI